MEILLETPATFNFQRTALSHGWYGLLPFELNEDQWSLSRVFDVGTKRPVTASIKSHRNGLVVLRNEQLSAKAVVRLVGQIQHIMRLDDDMTGFYTLLENEERFNWVASAGAGRMLRSPTVFEDLIKTLCTTNCSWSATKKMVTSIVQNLGTPAKDGRRAFPSPEVLAAQTEDFYRTEVRAGYRSGYLLEAATRVASGELEIEQWLHSALPTAELKKKIKRVKGVGDYAAENLLKLIGRYDGLDLDSWLRAKFAENHNRGRKATDKKIERHYARFKEWRGLAMWCDMTRDWLEPVQD